MPVLTEKRGKAALYPSDDGAVVEMTGWGEGIVSPAELPINGGSCLVNGVTRRQIAGADGRELMYRSGIETMQGDDRPIGGDEASAGAKHEIGRIITRWRGVSHWQKVGESGERGVMGNGEAEAVMVERMDGWGVVIKHAGWAPERKKEGGYKEGTRERVVDEWADCDFTEKRRT
jgi:hypothetical protein